MIHKTVKHFIYLGLRTEKLATLANNKELEKYS